MPDHATPSQRVVGSTPTRRTNSRRPQPCQPAARALSCDRSTGLVSGNLERGTARVPSRWWSPVMVLRGPRGRTAGVLRTRPGPEGAASRPRPHALNHRNPTCITCTEQPGPAHPPPARRRHRLGRRQHRNGRTRPRQAQRVTLAPAAVRQAPSLLGELQPLIVTHEAVHDGHVGVLRDPLPG